MSNTPRRYLNYNNIKNLNQGRNAADTIEVTCYNKFVYYVVPNPNDKQRVKEAEDAYEMGVYVSKDYIYMKLSDFNDQKNWNQECSELIKNLK